MSWQPRRVRIRPASEWGIALLLVASGLVTPAFATAANKLASEPASLPYCGHFSTEAVARLTHVGPLTVRSSAASTLGNECAWITDYVSGHYSSFIEVQIFAVPLAAFQAGERAARAQATGHNETYTPGGGRGGTIPGASAEYSLVRLTDSKSLPACEPGAKRNQVGPPECNGDPAWETATVVAYGALKPGGTMAEVTASVSGEPPVYLHGPAGVDEEILSGQL